jgi:hypothetical protein
MKKIKILSVLVLMVFNFALLIPTSDANPTTGLTKGLKGSINDIVTCHCPDDKGDCYCSMQ